MEVVFVTFESELGTDALEETLRERAEKFREVDGLVQKFYLQDDDSGRVGGFYMFDSAEARDAFFDSDLRATIGEAYAVKGDPDVSTYHLLFPLREAEGLPASA